MKVLSENSKILAQVAEGPMSGSVFGAGSAAPSQHGETSGQTSQLEREPRTHGARRKKQKVFSDPVSPRDSLEAKGRELTKPARHVQAHRAKQPSVGRANRGQHAVRTNTWE